MARLLIPCAFPLCTVVLNLAPWEAKTSRFCSQKCYHADRDARQAQVSFADRFWSKVDKTPGHGPQGECWLWIGATHANGYGNFRATPHKPGNVSAHIVSFFITAGHWPEDGLFVLHRCDVPPCVFPGHLWLGTHADNMQDCIQKGRNGMTTMPERAREGVHRYNLEHPTRPHTSGNRNGMRLHPESVLRGDKSPVMKVTEAQVAEAARLYATGQWTYEQLGKRYSVTGAAIRYRIQH